MHQRDLTERLLRLRGVPVLRGMTTAELAPLAASMRSATFEKGDIVMREDQPPRSFHLLLTGAVTMWRHKRRIRRLEAPGGVGFLSLLARTAGGTEVVAEARTETFELRSDALDEMFEDHFTVLIETLRWIAERLLLENVDQTPMPFTPPADGFDAGLEDRELGIVERIFLVRRTPPFRQANVNSTARLARRLKEIRVPAGTSVWRPGDKADASIFIVKGMMDLKWKDSTGAGVTQVVGPGYVLGGAEILANKVRWNELSATEPATYLWGGKEALIDMFEDDFEVARQFMSTLATYLLMLWDRKAEAEAVVDSRKPRELQVAV